MIEKLLSMFRRTERACCEQPNNLYLDAIVNHVNAIDSVIERLESVDGGWNTNMAVLIVRLLKDLKGGYDDVDLKFECLIESVDMSSIYALYLSILIDDFVYRSIDCASDGQFVFFVSLEASERGFIFYIKNQSRAAMRSRRSAVEPAVPGLKELVRRSFSGSIADEVDERYEYRIEIVY